MAPVASIVTVALHWKLSVLLLVTIIVSGAIGAVLHFLFLWMSKWLAGRAHATERNQIAGHFLGVIGVLYAVLLAFVVVTAWQQHDHTEELAMQEEFDVADLFHVIGGYGANAHAAQKIRLLLLDYASHMRDEWAEMQDGSPLCPDNSLALDECQSMPHHPSWINNAIAHNVVEAVVNVKPKTPRDQVVYQQSIALADSFAQDREHRRHHYPVLLDPVLWWAFFFGALILIGVTYFAAGQEARSQLVRTMALSAMIGMMLALATVFDHPFTGSEGINGSPWDTMVVHFTQDMTSR